MNTGPSLGAWWLRLPARVHHVTVVFASLVLSLWIAVAFQPTGLATQWLFGEVESKTNDVLSLSDGQVRIESLETIADPSYALTVNQVSKMPGTPHSLRKQTQFGLERSAIWARVRIHNDSLSAQKIYLELAPPRLLDVRFYRPVQAPGQQGTAWAEEKSGGIVPTDQRAIDNLDILLPLTLAAGEHQTVMLRIYTLTASNFLLRLHAPERFVAEAFKKQIQEALVFGALLVLGFVALGMGLVERVPLHIYFSLRTFAALAWVLAQSGYFAVWLPHWWVQTLTPANIGFGLLCAIAVMLWYRELFRLAPPALQTPWFFNAWLGAELLLSAVWLCALLDSIFVTRVMGFFTILIAVLMCGLAIRAIMGGFYLACVMLIGQLSVLLFGAAGLMTLLGYPPAQLSSYTIVPITFLVTSVVSFFATAAQIWAERRKARQALHETRQAAMAELETKVAERTQDLQIAKDQAQQANAAKGLFLAKVSHELRTPLHAVLGYTALTQQATQAAPLKRHLATVTDSANSLLHLIEDLVDYSRVEQDSVQIMPAPCNPRELLQEIERLVAMRPALGGNNLSVSIAPDVPAWVQLDRRRIKQVLVIFLNNALRHTQKGSVRVTLSATASDEQWANDETSLHFCVADTGSGIALSDQAKIFEPFERGSNAHPNSDDGGVGLGLAIAKQLLLKMGSHIALKSAPGQGSQFSFALPCAICAEPAVSATPEAQAYYTGYTTAAGSTDIKHILVLDDTDSNRHFLRELLSDLGLAVHAFAGQVEALAFLQQAVASGSPVDAMVVDQRLTQGHTGWGFLRQARTLAGMAHCPAFMLSALEANPPVDWPAGMHSIEQHFLKPLNISALLDALGQALGLNWQGAALPGHLAETEAHGATDAGQVDAPGASDWLDLASAAERAELSDLLLWAKRHPAAAALWEKPLATMDFSAIAALARAQAASSIRHGSARK